MEPFEPTPLNTPRGAADPDGSATPSTVPSTRPATAQSGPGAQPLLSFSREDTPPPQHSLNTHDSSSHGSGSHESYAVVEPDTSHLQLPKPKENDIQEMCGMLKVKTSMLAMGACERIKKLARSYPSEIIQSPLMDELVGIIRDGPGTPLANAALGALATMALRPEGRQRIVMQGGVAPLVKLIGRCDLTRPNTDRAVQLLMNLAADVGNRRTIREAGGVEALVSLMRQAPLEPVLEHALGALHNVMLTDSKAKTRAMDAGVAYPLARILAARLDESHTLAVRGRMIISDLLRVPDMQARLIAAATEQGVRIPGLMANVPSPSKRATDASNVSVPVDVHGQGTEEESEGGVLTGLEGEGEAGVSAVTEGIAAL